jgi:hypothetical protein
MNIAFGRTVAAVASPSYATAREPSSDQMLIRRIARGDQLAMRALFARHQTPLSAHHPTHDCKAGHEDYILVVSTAGRYSVRPTAHALVSAPAEGATERLMCKSPAQ